MRRSVFILLIVAAVLLLIVLAVPFLVDANQFRPAIESALTKSLGREVKIGDLKLGILSGTVTASDLSVADNPSFSRTAFLHAKALTLSIDLRRALFSRKLRVTGMQIDEPEIALIQLPSGVWNFSSLGTKSSAQPQGKELDLSVKSLKINGALLSLVQAAAKPETLNNVSIELKDFAPGSVFPVSLSAKMAGGGDVSLEGKAGPIDSADVAKTPLTAALKVANLNLAAAGIGGVVSMNGTISSNGQGIGVTGKARAEKLKGIRNPLLVDFAVSAGQLSRGDVAIGAVKASLTGTWSSQGLNMVLSAPGVPVSGLMELLPALNIVLPAGTTMEGGTAAAKLAVTGPISGLVVSGPVSVRNTRLKGFNLGAKMSLIEKLAGIKSGPDTEIQSLSANVRTAGDVTSLQNMDLVLPSVGELTGSGTIGRNHTLSFRMQASVRAAGKIPFSITGTSADPQFQPDVEGLAEEEITRGLNSLFGGKKPK